MSFLVVGYGYIVEDQLVLSEFGGDGNYTVPGISHSPIFGSEDIEIDECIGKMEGLDVGVSESKRSEEPPYRDDVPDDVANTIYDVFDDFRINKKTVINIKLSKLIGTTIYMTTFSNFMECSTVVMFTFNEPLLSNTCYSKSYNLTHSYVSRPPHVSDDDIIALAKLLKRSVYPESFVFHGLVEEATL